MALFAWDRRAAPRTPPPPPAGQRRDGRRQARLSFYGAFRRGIAAQLHGPHPRPRQGSGETAAAGPAPSLELFAGDRRALQDRAPAPGRASGADALRGAAALSHARTLRRRAGFGAGGSEMTVRFAFVVLRRWRCSRRSRWVSSSRVRRRRPSPAERPTAPASDRSHFVAGEELAKTVTVVTGVPISPLLGVSALGAWRYYRHRRAAARRRCPGTRAPGSGGAGSRWSSCSWPTPRSARRCRG